MTGLLIAAIIVGTGVLASLGCWLADRHVDQLQQRLLDTPRLPLGPSLREGRAGVRRESRPAARADLTGSLTVRSQEKEEGLSVAVAHAGTGSAPEDSDAFEQWLRHADQACALTIATDELALRRARGHTR